MSFEKCKFDFVVNCPDSEKAIYDVALCETYFDKMTSTKAS